MLVMSLVGIITMSAYQTITALAPGSSDIAAPAGQLGQPAANSQSSVTQAGSIVSLTPVRLVIPSIHVDARVESRGLDANRNLDTAQDSQDAAWYNRGPAPGQPGNALINGHVNWWTGDAVFSRLKLVRIGDKVQVIRADGTSLLFTVTARQTVGADARLPQLFASGKAAMLTLITCAGIWNPLTMTNTQRLLVSASIA
jgi:LPXTG-site transpeptidase (sortase) family protein